MTIPVGGRLPRLRRQAWVFWAVIVATVVMALASVAYAGRNLTVAFPSAVAVGSHPTGKLPIGAGAQAPHTVTVVQPSHPVEVLDGGDRTSSSSSAASSQSTAPATVESGNPQAGSAMASAPTSVDESPIASPPPAGPGSGTGTTGATSTTTTTTTVATTTTTTWGESDDGPDRSATTTRSGTRTGDE
ncbi:MAG TPA: hypothetical protein VID75_11115 [Acidimicrobiales bacterium]